MAELQYKNTTLSLRVEDTQVIKLRITNEQGRRLFRVYKKMLNVLEFDEGRSPRSDEIVDSIIALLHHEYELQEYNLSDRIFRLIKRCLSGETTLVEPICSMLEIYSKGNTDER